MQIHRRGAAGVAPTLNFLTKRSLRDWASDRQMITRNSVETMTDLATMTQMRAIDLLQGLVAIPSLSRNERAASEWLVVLEHGDNAAVHGTGPIAIHTIHVPTRLVGSRGEEPERRVTHWPRPGPVEVDP